MVHDEEKLTSESPEVREEISAYHFCSTSGFLFRYFFNRSLDLWCVDCLVFNLNDTTEYSLHLCEFVLVSSDEIQLGYRGHGASSQ